MTRQGMPCRVYQREAAGFGDLCCFAPFAGSGGRRILKQSLVRICKELSIFGQLLDGPARNSGERNVALHNIFVGLLHRGLDYRETKSLAVPADVIKSAFPRLGRSLFPEMLYGSRQ